jgi:hypothetical protein
MLTRDMLNTFLWLPWADNDPKGDQEFFDYLFFARLFSDDCKNCVYTVVV